VRQEADVDVSVIVPTRDRSDSLARCLTSLDLQQTAVPFEIVVVDDNSSRRDELREVVAGCSRARLVPASGGGPSAARNVGVEASHGHVVCFIDDDCIAAPDWLEHMYASIAGGASAAGGRTLNGRSGDALAEASQLIANSLAVTIEESGRILRFAPSNNLCCRADVVHEVPFDSAFDTAGGEDRDWCARLLERGHELRAESAALVFHHQRLDLSAFWRQQIRYGRGAYRFRRRHGGITRFESGRFYRHLVREGFRRGSRIGLLVLLAQLATAYGYASAFARERRSVSR
jgi:glycosyltransferase involved in cell wall biosynthesis